MPDSEAAADLPLRTGKVAQDQAGSRLDAFLARWLEISRSEVRRLLSEGAASLDGQSVGLRHKGLPLPAGASVEISGFRPADQRRARAAREGPVPMVLAEGPGWLAIDKPAGMPVHPLREDEIGTALGQIASLHPEIQGVGEAGLRSGVVHRLDVDTSGVMLMATEQSCWERLRRAFSEQQIEKTYLAIVRGEFFGERQLDLMLRVSRHRPARVRVASEGQDGAREVSMRVKALESYPAATLVEVVPKSGFLHQIRAALAHIGHPLLGDQGYGEADDESRAARHMLHAQALRFEEIVASCDPPQDFRGVLEGLRI